eukprot:6940635-Karenia_brevis.AAC.1
MALHAAEAGLLTVEAFARHYDSRTSDAVQRWLAELPEDLHHEVNGAISDASEIADAWWRAARS